jgi:hypothetical protein
MRQALAILRAQRAARTQFAAPPSAILHANKNLTALLLASGRNAVNTLADLSATLDA